MTAKNTKTDSAPEELFFAQNTDIIPTIRIAQIEINGFKSVEHGKLVLECGKQLVPRGTQSDILGIYGQNGSGKTSLIEALSILCMVMSGDSVLSSYTDCISVKSGVSTLDFTFDLQYLDGKISTVEYKFSIKKAEVSKEEMTDQWQKLYGGTERIIDESFYDDERHKYKICVFDEVIKISSMHTDGEKVRLQTLIDTSSKQKPFAPERQLQELVGKSKDLLISLMLNKELASNESRSFIFSAKTLKLLMQKKNCDSLLDIIMALRYFATKRLFVIDTKAYGFIGLNAMLPMHTSRGFFMGKTGRGRMLASKYDKISQVFSDISSVLTQLVPGLTISLKKLSDTIMSSGEPGIWVIPMAKRGDKEIPLRDESDGVRKIISILDLIILAYNDESVTIAIDEFDAGIFEYLLGEILQSFEESGKGQFIFTSHNLRPLEVIDKKFIAFTTTNENNRYYRFKDISSTNNLRDRYFREILLGEQEESLYSRTKRFKIEAAMRRIGRNSDDK